MFLKSLDMYGFKSFADKTHIDFSDGITSLLGPNGCGKSNIVDAVKWVLGEQSMKTIRAGKKEDVIFNGTDTRKPMTFAEVTLVIDNSEHRLPTEVEEIEIRRRVFRSGDSEYYLNKNRCLLRNILELFYDTGVGKSAYSILEQGKIDQILSSKPEDRRYVFEEAAGISRFKQQCNEAQNKIARTDENIRDIEVQAREAEKTCNRTRSQADRARKAKDLRERLFQLDIQFHIGQLRNYQRTNDERLKMLGEGEALIAKYRRDEEELSQQIGSAQEEMRAQDELLHRLQLEINTIEGRISTADQTIGLFTKSFQESSLRASEYDERAGNIRSQLDRDTAELDDYVDSLSEKRDQLEESGRHLDRLRKMLEESGAKVSSLEAEAERREKRNEEIDSELIALSEELKEVIEGLIAEVDENTGTEYSKERKDSAATAFRTKGEEARKLLEEKISQLSSLKESIPISRDVMVMDFRRADEAVEAMIALFEAYVASIPPVVDTLLSPEGLVGKKRDIEKREIAARAEMNENRIMIAAHRAEIQSTRADMENLRGTIDAANESYIALKTSLEASEAIIESKKRAIEERRISLDDAVFQAESARRRMEEIQEELRAKDEEKLALADELAQKREEAASAGKDRGSRGEELERKRQERERIINLLTRTQNDMAQIQGQVDSSGAFTETILTNFFNKYTRNLGEFMKEYEDKELPNEQLIQNELQEVQRELAGYGNVNWMAEQEYEESLEQYKFYAKQLEDLGKAKADLEQVLAEIQSRSEELFTKTYKEISTNFQTMFRRLFGGGRAEITLDDPENVLTSGIDILAQPPGKKPQFLGQLSGGERAMTAVALLFATYQVKPSPFCILDELDAPLDDRNIGFFLSVLQDFAKSSQFIIITHNPHTVMGSQTLLGVTQIEAGVSTTVTYKLGNLEGEPVILSEDNKAVSFSSDGRAQ